MHFVRDSAIVTADESQNKKWSFFSTCTCDNYNVFLCVIRAKKIRIFLKQTFVFVWPIPGEFPHWVKQA